MGETYTILKIYGKNNRSAELNALIDTGATFAKIPPATASQLKLEVKYETEVELADGRVIRRGLALAEVEVEGVRRPILIAIGEKEDRPLIGYTVLEILGFKLNPLTRKLEKAMAIEHVATSKNNVPRYQRESVY